MSDEGNHGFCETIGTSSWYLVINPKDYSIRTLIFDKKKDEDKVLS